MTVHDLYRLLKEKGYVNHDADRAYENVLSAQESGNTDAVSHFETDLHTALEMDRREVFRVWHGDSGQWRAILMTACHKHIYREIDGTIDYLLTDNL